MESCETEKSWNFATKMTNIKDRFLLNVNTEIGLSGDINPNNLVIGYVD